MVLGWDMHIEAELVDAIGLEIIKGHYNHVINVLSEEGISLTKQQIFPLVAITHLHGNISLLGTYNEYELKKIGKTFAQTYKEASVEYEEKSWKHNRYVWDEWWSKVGGNNATHFLAKETQFETYVKGIFDYDESITGGIHPVYGKTMYLFYTEEQLDRAENYISGSMPRQIKCERNNPDAKMTEEEIFTTIQITGEYVQSTEPLISGYYTSGTGRRFTILNQILIDEYSDGWSGYCNRAASAIIASGYSDKTPKELVDDIDKKYVTDSIIPSTEEYFGSYGLDRVYFEAGHKDVNTYTEILREHLRKGGYAAVWVTDPNGYEGKSRVWTSGTMHWVAILDYKIENGKEKMVIADWKEARWYDIDEFCNGIDNLALISEK